MTARGGPRSTPSELVGSGQAEAENEPRRPSRGFLRAGWRSGSPRRSSGALFAKDLERRYHDKRFRTKSSASLRKYSRSGCEAGAVVLASKITPLPLASLIAGEIRREAWALFRGQAGRKRPKELARRTKHQDWRNAFEGVCGNACPCGRPVVFSRLTAGYADSKQPGFKTA